MTETRVPRLLRRLLQAGWAALALGAPALAADAPPGNADPLPEFPIAAPHPAAAPAELPAPAAGPELSVGTLVEQVLARNPSLAQMVAAWKAAQARYPQVTA